MSGIPVFPHQTKEINVPSIAYASCVSLARSPTPPRLITTILTRVSRSHACLNIFVAFVCVPKEEYRLHVSAFLYKIFLCLTEKFLKHTFMLYQIKLRLLVE